MKPLQALLLGVNCSIMTQLKSMFMGCGQYEMILIAGFMGGCPHGKDWMAAELYLSVSSGKLIVNKDTNGKDGCHGKRIDRHPLYSFAIGNTPGHNVAHRGSPTTA